MSGHNLQVVPVPRGKPINLCCCGLTAFKGKRNTLYSLVHRLSCSLNLYGDNSILKSRGRVVLCQTGHPRAIEVSLWDASRREWPGFRG